MTWRYLGEFYFEAGTAGYVTLINQSDEYDPSQAVIADAIRFGGGLGSIEGAMIGSAIVGIVRAAAVHILPEVELFVIYGVMALVLAFKPHGLFAGPEVRKI